ncbi:MAG TPA: YbdD/YjiX family protein [Burkholderiales bacterium]|nr:YbdD/YjiX family protein [Burkholderiales bacterium]
MTGPLRSFWRFLRQASGDDAYERYLAHHRAHHPGQPPLTRADYFRFCQEQKWSKLSRCC